MIRKRIAIVGGCGHVGLPLGVKFALSGAETVLVDVNKQAVAKVNSGRFPFLEKGGDEQLVRALELGLRATTDAEACRDVEAIVFVTGTPVDEHLNPKLAEVIGIFDDYKRFFKKETLVVMRSTLFPGTMEHLWNKVRKEELGVCLAFCPERVAQGVALDEIDSLPQIVSAFDEGSFEAAYQLFSQIAPSVIKLSPLEAEITKLMANSWRYLEFAIANQFYMIAEKSGVDFYRIFQAIRYDYPRAQGYKAPGFAAGPCLFKDTMQLASFYDHQFYLGHSAMLVNEGLASFAVEKLEKALGSELWSKTIGVLGMGFKANNDDPRESLSFKVKKTLEFKGAHVLTHDPYFANECDLQTMLDRADGVILGTPHRDYAKLKFNCPVIDVWGYYGLPKLEVLPGKTMQKN